MKKQFLTMFAGISSIFSFADPYADLSAYKEGKSLAWYYEIKADALADGVKAEEKILETIVKSDISNEAFGRACELLKPIASENAIPAMAQNLADEFRSPWACDVLRTIESSDADDALKSALETLKGRPAQSALYTLAARRADFSEGGFLASIFSDSTVDIVKRFAFDNDPETAKFATGLLGKFADTEAVETLSKIAVENNFKSEAAVRALVAIADAALANGDESLAREAVARIPDDRHSAINARAILSGNYVEYLDKLLAENSPNMKYAARLAGFKRTFDNSKFLFANFDSFSDAAKTAAIGSFTLTQDPRFFTLAEKCLDSKNPYLKNAAVYSARYLCETPAPFEKIIPLASVSDVRGFDFNESIYSLKSDSPEKTLSQIAAKVVMENKSRALKLLLEAKAANGDLKALFFLSMRGDSKAQKNLWNMFYSGGFKDSKVVEAVEKSLSFGEIKSFAKKLRTDNTELQNAIVKIVVEKFSKSHNAEFVRRELDAALWGNIDFDSPLYAEICKKLKIDLRRKVGVQMSTFYNLSFFDSIPLLKKAGVSHIGLTSQKIGGKYPNAHTNETATPEQRAYLKDLLEENSLVPVSFGVRSPKDTAGIRAVCEFANEFFVKIVLTESPDDTMPVWQKLADEFDLKVAIHNHPKPENSDYKNCDPNHVAKFAKKFPRIYACADNGHWARGAIAPSKAFEILSGRTGIVHVKDIDKFGTNAANDVVIGNGCADVAASMKQLDAQKFDGWYLIEHEVWKFTPQEKQIAEIRDNVKFLKKH